VLDRVKEIIAGDGGVLVKVDEWGKRRLAYEIKHQPDGFYYFLYFQATPKTLDEVTRVLGITETVLRFRPIRHEKPFVVQQPVAATSSAAAAAPAPTAASSDDQA
jgi:small subunit ribosomal protein S6